jgi:hypothetical protein
MLQQRRAVIPGGASGAGCASTAARAAGGARRARDAPLLLPLAGARDPRLAAVGPRLARGAAAAAEVVMPRGAGGALRRARGAPLALAAGGAPHAAGAACLASRALGADKPVGARAARVAQVAARLPRQRRRVACGTDGAAHGATGRGTPRGARGARIRALTTLLCGVGRRSGAVARAEPPAGAAQAGTRARVVPGVALRGGRGADERRGGAEKETFEIRHGRPASLERGRAKVGKKTKDKI